jgi:hypothetical protein
MLQLYVSSVSYRCCKSRSGCCKSRSRYCTCCNGYARMFQVYVLNVSSVSNICCKCSHLDVAHIWMFQVFYMFHTSLASVSSRCRICLQWVSSVFRHFRKCFKHLYQVFYLSSLYITTVASRCFKSRSRVAHRVRVGSSRRRGRHLQRRAWATSRVASPCR